MRTNAERRDEITEKIDDLIIEAEITEGQIADLASEIGGEGTVVNAVVKNLLEAQAYSNKVIDYLRSAGGRAEDL